MRKVLVTGASGFIGTELVGQLLHSGINLKTMGRKNTNELRMGFIDQDFFQDIRVDVEYFSDIDFVFHLAGIAHAESTNFTWNDYYQVNVKATEQLVDLAGIAGVKKFIFVSSVKAIGNFCEEYSGASEPTADPYGMSKFLAEKAVIEISAKYKMDYVIIRPALVYGPEIKGNLLKMIQAIDQGRFPSIPKVANRRSLVHVSDLCRALILVASNKSAVENTYIVSDLKQYSTRDIYEAMMMGLGKPLSKLFVPKLCFSVAAKLGDMVEKITGKRMPLNSASIEKLFGSAYYDGSEICEQLEFKPMWTLERAMPEIVVSYRKSI